MNFTISKDQKKVHFISKTKRRVHFTVVKSRVRLGFMSSTQMPLIMIWREYYKRGRVEHAATLFSVYLPWRKPFPSVPVFDFSN